jgi:hypothetical protein
LRRVRSHGPIIGPYNPPLAQQEVTAWTVLSSTGWTPRPKNSGAQGCSSPNACSRRRSNRSCASRTVAN